MDPSAVLVPIRQAVEEPVLVEPNEIPLNHTDLGNKVKVADNATFHKRKPRGKKNEEILEEDMLDPEV